MEGKPSYIWSRTSGAIGGLTWGAFFWMCVVSAALGLVISLLVWLFSKGFNLIFNWLFNDLSAVITPYGRWPLALIPAAGGILVALILHLFSKPEKFDAMTHVIYGVVEKDGRLNNRNGLVYIIASMVGIGFGVPVGDDTPSAMIGAHLASFFGERTHQKKIFVQAIVIAGIAAGIAATYDAQISGIFFALEIVLGGFGGVLFVVPALIGVAVSAFFTFLVGTTPIVYSASIASAVSKWTIILYIVVAILASLAAIFYVRLLSFMRDGWHKLKLPYWVKPVLAGLLVGIVGLWVPGVFGTGLDQMKQIFTGAQFTISGLVILTLARTILTPTCLGAGFAGGVISPAIAIGSALGLAFGELVVRLDPGLGVSPITFAMVATACILAATLNAPLFGAMLVLEMTSDIVFLVPILVGVAISFALARAFLPGSAYTSVLSKMGIELQPESYQVVRRDEKQK